MTVQTAGTAGSRTEVSSVSPPDGSRPRRSLVLAGGGMRVAYQAGVIRALAEAGIVFDHADGASGGTINLAMLLSGVTPEEMCTRWQTLDPKRFVSLPPLQELVKAPNLLGWGDADGIIEHVFPHLGIDVDAIRAHRGLEGTFNVCNFSRKTAEVIPHTEIDRDLLVAGISLPIFMPPVYTRGAWYTDAVWIKDANVVEAVRRGAEEVWLVWCIGNTSEYHRGPFQQYVHMIEMAANGSLFEQFDRITEQTSGARPVVLHVIKPDLPLPLDPDYYLGRITGTTLTEMGYADAWRYLHMMHPEGLPWRPEATQMTIPKPGITFAETMAGHFALGATDPKDVTSVSAETQHELAIHVTVQIDDIDRFVRDPQHLGRLTGHIDFAPFGANIPATRGVFNLFSPTDDPTLTLMVYELAFRHQGSAYYLAGRKEVRDGPAFDLWSDTTTLYTTLHEGDSSAGSIVGAGVLRLGVTELVKLVGSIHATNTTSIADGARVIATFGSFFLKELWATYGAHHSQTPVS